LDVFLELIWFRRRGHLSCFRGGTVHQQPFIHHARGNEEESAMQAAQVTETVPNADRELRAAKTPPATADGPLTMADKLVAISFLIGLALFGLISVIDLVTSLFR
jgi:hypothetical protein